MKRFGFLHPLFFLCLIGHSQAQTPSRFDSWKTGAHYRGFNIVADEYQKSLTDLRDIPKAGGTIIHIGTKGFRNVEAPYSPVDSNIAFLDKMIAMCDDAGLHYSLTVRQGPGRRDVYLEGIGEPLSTIWTDTTEQQEYASMLREIVQRYRNDSLFIGIAPITEPNPLSKNNFYYDTASLHKLLITNKIDLQRIYQVCVDSIRSVMKEIPVLVQGPAFAAPEFIPLAPKINDPFIVYEFHCYRPHEFVYASDTSTLVYPGNYISYIERKLSVLHDKQYLKDSVFKYINSLAKETGAPIFMGEFGVEWPHSGGEQLLGDLSSIAIENGWHFAYWAYDGLHHGWGWDYQVMPQSYWVTVVKSFEGNLSVAPTSIEEPSILIFLNPSDGIITVQVSEITNSGTVSLSDILGHRIKEIRLQNGEAQFHIEDLPSGEYLVVIQTEKGIARRKVMLLK